MAFKYVILAACIAVAQAGFLAAPAAVGASQQSVTRSLDGSSVVSTYAKQVDTPYSSVRKFNTQVSNDAVAYAHAPVYAQTYAAAPAYAQTYAAAPAYASYAAPAVAHSYAAAPAYTSYAAPIAKVASPLAYAAPVAHAAYAHPAVAAVSPYAARLGVAYSAAPAVAHYSFDGLGAHYAF